MGNMQYIAARRARFDGIAGRVNLKYGTALEAVDGFLTYNGLRVCAVTSQNAHDYFAKNDDGNGLERGRLTASVIARLSKRDREYQTRWDRIWADPLCQKYKREDSADFWLWNHAFFEAPLEDLRRIARLAGVREVGA